MAAEMERPPGEFHWNVMINQIENISDLVESISEKVSIDEYLKKGIELYSLG